MGLGRIVGAALLLCTGGPLAAWPAEPVSLEALFGDPTYLGAKISPKGDYIAVTTPYEDQTILAVLDRETLEARSAFRLNSNIHVWEYWWVNDQRIVFNVVRKLGYLDFPLLTGDLFGVDADGSNFKKLFGPGVGDFAHHQVIHLLPAQRHKILIVSWKYYRRERFDKFRPEAMILDVRGELMSGATGTWLTSKGRRDAGHGPLPNGYLRADNSGAIRIATGFKDGRPQLFHRSMETGDWTDLSDLLGGQGEIRVQAVGFTPDDRKVYVLKHDGEGTRGLYTLDPEARTFEPLFSDDTYDVDPNDLIWSKEGNEVIGVTYMADRPRQHLLEVESREARLNRSLWQAFKGQETRITSYTEDGSHAVVEVRSDRNPGAYYLFDTERMSAARLFGRRPGIDAERMAAMRPITVEARDGMLLHGYLTIPPGREPARLPMVVVVHGGPQSRDVDRFDPEVQLLASRGYAVLQINYRGSGGFGGAFERAGYRNWGGTMQDDVTDATRWAIAEGIADPERVCIYGASFGAYSALMGAIREPGLYRCAAAYAGIYDLPLMFGEGDIPRYREGELYLEDMLGTDEEDLKARSPVHKAGAIEAALFIAHGGRDERAPLEHFHRLRKALDEAGKDYEWLLEPHEGHGFYQAEHRIELYRRLLAFFDRATAVPR